jgi:hypothetical protein
MECAKFDCQNQATHVLVMASESLGTVEAHARCEPCGKLDVKFRLPARVIPDAAVKLVPMPVRRSR